MSEGATLGEIARLVRSKNAGPFWITLDVFFAEDDDYQRVLRSGAVNRDQVSYLYGVRPDDVRIYELPAIRVIKISFPKPIPQGAFLDNDMHAGQSFVPLARLAVD